MYKNINTEFISDGNELQKRLQKLQKKVEHRKDDN